MRVTSKIAKEWWDYTTLDEAILRDAARLTVKDIEQLARPGFRVVIHDTRESFFLAEALEYIEVWKQSKADAPVGICGPIGPTEQLPLVAELVNSLGLDVRSAHFWGMDEWVVDGKELSPSHPLSFAKADHDLCLDRISPKLRMPDSNIHFPSIAGLSAYSESFSKVRCLIMQGGQGEVKHWAFNDPPQRLGKYVNEPPTPQEMLQKPARVVDLHPMTLIQNARTSSGGIVSDIPSQALTVGPKETWHAEKVSIWHPGWHDNPFGMRLTTLMISKKIADAAVPMSLLALHPNVQFNFLRTGIGTCEVEMH